MSGPLYNRVQALADRTSCGAKGFRVLSRTADIVTVQVIELRPDNAGNNPSGARFLQEGRPWIISPGDTDDQILNTFLKAVLTFEEHEIRELFRVDNKALYEPRH